MSLRRWSGCTRGAQGVHKGSRQGAKRSLFGEEWRQAKSATSDKSRTNEKDRACQEC